MKEYFVQQLFRNEDLIISFLEIDRKNENIDDLLNQVCELVTKSVVENASVFIRISCFGKTYTNIDFKETLSSVNQNFKISDQCQGLVELFFENREINDSSVEIGLKIIISLLVGLLSEIQLEKLTYEIGERQKELQSIKKTTDTLKKNTSIEGLLQEICSFLPEAMQYPEHTVALIQYGNLELTSSGFRSTPWRLQKTFETPDLTSGLIEIYYLKEFPLADEGPFLKEERHLIDNLVELISGTVSKKALEVLLIKNTERLKELKGINQTSQILKNAKSIESALSQICQILPEAWQYPEHTVARIIYEKNVFQSSALKETPWKISQGFEAPGNKKGVIEIFYLKDFPEADEGPFLKEERNLLINLSTLIAGSAARDVFNKFQHENAERLKELKAINQTAQIIDQEKTIDETLMEICSILPKSWQHSRHAVSRIRFEGRTYTSIGFIDTDWIQTETFVTIDNKKGFVEICYLKQMPNEDEGPFLKEERNLLINIAKLIGGYLNNYKGREILSRKPEIHPETHPNEEFRNSLINSKKPLQQYFNQQAIDKYIYLDMMKYKVKHILFVSTLYDAFTLESEDSFFEKFMGEAYQYSLFSVPRITGVSSAEEALLLLETTSFDLVILMAGIDREAPILFSEQIKEKKPTLPIYLLLNKKSDIKYFEDLVPTIGSIDKLFVWNGDSLILFAIVKSTEDKINVENDTKIGLVRVILLIEDSPLYYSKYLQILYDIVFGHVQHLLPEVEKNELDKICKMRSRPKILHAQNYEEAIAIFHKYKDFLLCVISDVEFDRGGKMDKHAGFNFIKYIKSHVSKLPIILQSSENRNEKIAKELNVRFINKNSESLLNDLKLYLNNYLGFGNFVFRDNEGNKIGVARSLREFETLLKEIPDESLFLHASENQLSLWLMARGEIQLARTLNPISVNEFKNMEETRKFFLETINHYREEKKKGKILSFDETSALDEKNIVSFAGGSLGGKGRGLAFINTLIYNLEFPGLSDKINILAPITVIIGSDEFEHFIAKNNLFEKIISTEIPYNELRHHFAEAQLSSSLIKKLKVFLSQIDKPIAVRSSSSTEDSITQPFAGVFDTYIVPNHSTNKKLAFERLSLAIKLVFASTFSGKARNYFSIIHHKIEEEKMAVVLQELVGTNYGRYYYPHISGVAQSYNYYPVANMKPEEGFALAAVGLGTYVVDGWKSFRFSPKYPKVSVYGISEMLTSSQVQFYALDCHNENFDFLEDGELAALKLLDISEAEKDGALTHCVSVYNQNNDRIEPGINGKGPRIVNFANILQYNHIPLAQTLHVLLNTVKDAFGSPVELEFAVDLTPAKNGLPSFYLLQIKPMIGTQDLQPVEMDKVDISKIVLHTRSSLGNGQIKGIKDVIFVDRSKFSKLKTIEMAAEIEVLNKLMIKANKQYVLIGPGRWGSRDRFVGIPVNWSQISNAKMIVEVSLFNYPLDSSLGSHFFHNVTSMNIGYCSIQDSSTIDFVNWDILEEQKIVSKTQYFKHIEFKQPIAIMMDGKHKIATITYGTID